MSKTARPSRSPDAARRRPSRPARPGNSRRAPQPSLAAHRLFPGLVGLWFAALFGLGALVAGAGALASLVGALHLPAILPAAAPPLGMTARLLVAIALAGGGGVFGLLLGQVMRRRLAGPRPAGADAPDADLFEGNAFDPDAFAPDAFGDEGPGDALFVEPAQAPAATGRRRAFSAAALREEEAAPKVRARDAHPDAPPRRPLVVTEDVAPFADLPLATPVAEPVESGPEREPDPVVEATPAPVAVESPTAVEPVPAVADSARAPEPARVAPAPLAALAVTAPQVPLEAADLDSLGLVQLIERLARAIATRQDLRAAAQSGVSAPPALAPALASQPAVPEIVVREPVLAAPEPAEPLLRTKPPRLARSADAGTPLSDPAAVPAPPSARLFDPLASFASAPIEFGQEPSGEDLADDALLAPRFLGEDAPGMPDDTLEARYSSLTGATLARPDLGRFAIVDEMPAIELPAPEQPASRQTDPVVPFPVPPGRMTGRSDEPGVAADASGGSDGEADRALREALATLRRMTARG